MSSRLAERLKNVQESSTLKMNSLAKEMAAKGLQVINLTAGEPDFPVHDHIKSAAKKSIDLNLSKYTPVNGILPLRESIASKLRSENNLNYQPNEVIVTVGAKQAIFNFLLAVINDGDEVIIPSPYWVSYPEMVKLAGGVPIIVNCDEKTGYKMSAKQLKDVMSEKTKVLLLNSPSNPTGSMIDDATLREYWEIIKDTQVLVCSDEIYEKLYFDFKPTSFASLNENAFKRTLTVNGFSKSYAMTGWRLGYAAGPNDIITAMNLIQSQSTSNPTSLVQYAALDALKLGIDYFQENRNTYLKRRNRMAELFSQCKDCSYFLPHGAFYFFLNIERLLHKSYNSRDGVKRFQDAQELAFQLLEETQVVTVPGNGFGSPHHLRISFSVSDQDIEEGCRRILNFFGKFN